MVLYLGQMPERWFRPGGRKAGVKTTPASSNTVAALQRAGDLKKVPPG